MTKEEQESETNMKRKYTKTLNFLCSPLLGGHAANVVVKDKFSS